MTGGVCGWVFRVFGGFKVGYRVFYGFLGWVNEMWGHRNVFHGFLRVMGFYLGI